MNYKSAPVKGKLDTVDHYCSNDLDYDIVLSEEQINSFIKNCIELGTLITCEHKPILHLVTT